MLKELKFVQGAVAKKDLIPGMTHFCIEKGVIRSYNGNLALSSPIAFDIDCKPNASQLIKAISNCSPEHVVTISMTAAGRLRIQNGPYRALVDCIDEETPHVKPEGDIVQFDGAAVRRAFENLLPFVGDDASRQWTNGILLHANSAYATNNVIICQFWLGAPIPLTLNIPSAAVREFLRIGEDPTHAQVTESSITFHFSDGRWIRSGLWETKQDVITKVLESCHGNPVDIHNGFFEGLKSIKAFTDKIGNVYFKDGELMTHLDETGAKFKLDNFPHTGCYSLEMLELLEGVVEKIDWSTYPKPIVFQSKELRGVLSGRMMPGEQHLEAS
jgi:DNA polymerase III sliding clamp (beta) subunit (PCNA family)